jgi:hypothetical protein
MRLWVVYGDDHDYDAMSQWLVGVYDSAEKAAKAAQEDRERYWKENKIGKRKQPGVPNIEVSEVALNERAP